jgi:hypothetical protein
VGLLGLEFQQRPGFAIGDETLGFRLSLELAQGAPLQWHWGRGVLHRAANAAWIWLVQPNLLLLHLPALLFFGLELLFLARLSRRWAGPGHAGWAVVAVLLSAHTWMRVRGLVGLQWTPTLLLGLAVASGWVRGRSSALLWGLSAALLLLEYEGAFLAAPFLWLACREHEQAFRRVAGWSAVAFGAGVLALGWLARGDWSHYSSVRWDIYLGRGDGEWLRTWLVNLRGILLGGLPGPSYGVDAWPFLPPWIWPGLALGLLPAWRRWRWAVLWSAALLFITQATRSPWGLPVHRLAGLAPAAAWIAALGLRRLWEAGRGARALVLGLLAFGLLGETHAWFRHMALHGRQLYGRSQLQAEAGRLARRAAAEGLGVQTALYEIVRPELAYFCSPVAAQPGADRILFVPPQLRLAALQSGLPATVLARSSNDEPVLLLRVPAARAARFDALERELRALQASPGEAPASASERDRAWLRRGGDAWAFAMLLERELRRAWWGVALNEEHLRWAGRADLASPAPLVTLGRFYRFRDPSAALQLLDRALRLDPAFSPALEERVKVLEDQGPSRALEEAREARWRMARAGAWQIYD